MLSFRQKPTFLETYTVFETICKPSRINTRYCWFSVYSQQPAPWGYYHTCTCLFRFVTAAPMSVEEVHNLRKSPLHAKVQTRCVAVPLAFQGIWQPDPPSMRTKRLATKQQPWKSISLKLEQWLQHQESSWWVDCMCLNDQFLDIASVVTVSHN